MIRSEAKYHVLPRKAISSPAFTIRKRIISKLGCSRHASMVVYHAVSNEWYMRKPDGFSFRCRYNYHRAPHQRCYRISPANFCNKSERPPVNAPPFATDPPRTQRINAAASPIFATFSTEGTARYWPWYWRTWVKFD